MKKTTKKSKANILAIVRYNKTDIKREKVEREAKESMKEIIPTVLPGLPFMLYEKWDPFKGMFSYRAYRIYLSRHKQ